MTIKLGTLNSRWGDSKVSHILETIEKYKLDVLYLQEVHNISRDNIAKIEKNKKIEMFHKPRNPARARSNDCN